MPARHTCTESRLVNGSIGDPALYIDYPGKNNALLFDAGELCNLDMQRLADLEAVFITHHHIDHFVGFDRIIRANMDADKTLHVFGPEGTIARVYHRLHSYAWQFFPFQKIVYKVHEVLEGRLRWAYLEFARHFPDPQIEEAPWSGPTIYENADLKVEAVHADHTAPCLAFALVEKTGYHPDPEKLGTGALRPGRWVDQALQLLRKGAPPDTTLDIQGGKFTLGLLGRHYFAHSPGARVAYVTDTLWSPKVKPALAALAARAQRLYCDSYYSKAERKQAQAHRHMTASDAARLARLARVQELILMHFAPRYRGRYHELVEEARALFPHVSADLDEPETPGARPKSLGDAGAVLGKQRE
jgi:ribonuclease Z